jgi:hypothetical protein
MYMDTHVLVYMAYAPKSTHACTHAQTHTHTHITFNTHAHMTFNTHTHTHNFQNTHTCTHTHITFNTHTHTYPKGYIYCITNTLGRKLQEQMALKTHRASVF